MHRARRERVTNDVPHAGRDPCLARSTPPAHLSRMRQSHLAVAFMCAVTWLCTSNISAQDNADCRCSASEARWIAALPFGAGQFQHGDVEVGAALLISETTLLAG